MANPEIDSNTWYSLYVNKNDSLLQGTDLFSRGGTAGAAFFVKAAPDDSTQRWQIFPVSNTTFVLRTQKGGSNAFLGAQPADEKGVISPLMLRGDVADDSVYWQFGRWGDGTHYLWNGGNGTSYHLGKNGTGIVMDKNITAPQNTQRWRWDAGAEINNAAYSSVNLLGVSLTSPATASSSPTVSSSPSTSPTTSAVSDPHSSTGLSTAAKAGIGAAVGIAAVIALVVLGLFLRRRRRRHRSPQSRASKPQDLAYEPYHGQPQGTVEVGVPALLGRKQEFVKHELDHGATSAKFEMPAPTVVEVDARGQELPAELEGRGGGR